MTISNPNNWSVPSIQSIEVQGEYLKYEDCDYDLSSHPENSFTKDEMEYYLKFYIDNIDNI